MAITVYSKPNCLPCAKLKSQLKLMGLEFMDVDITTTPQMREWLLEQGHRSVPQIYQNGVHVASPSQLTKEN